MFLGITSPKRHFIRRIGFQPVQPCGASSLSFHVKYQDRIPTVLQPRREGRIYMPLMTKSELYDAAMLLPPEDRAWLAIEIFKSLVEDEAARAFWAEEVDRRIESIENGDVETIPLGVVRQRLREEFGVVF